MSRAHHLQTFCAATAAWAIFWVAGLPSYYQQYSRTTMLVVCTILMPPIIGISYLLLRRLAPGTRIARANWLAFYFTVPLAFYDWLYCGLYLGYGVRFLRVFWYLTVFYVVPWIVLPLTAYRLNTRDA